MDNSGKLSGATIDREWFVFQEKEVFQEWKRQKFVIGLPNETDRDENRICLTPESAGILIDAGHAVIVQKGAGFQANYTDREYADVGARVVETPEEVYVADIVMKSTPVSLKDAECMRERQVIMSPLKLFELRRDAIIEMMHKKVTAIGFDILKDEDGFYPVVRIMSEICGGAAILIASEYLSNSRNGKGIFLGGITGITPTEIVILGAGTLGEYAARTALALGAVVKVFDHSLERLRRLNACLGQRVFTSVFHKPVLDRALLSADVVIGALRYFDDDQGVSVTEEQVKLMKRGAVIVDMSIDHGGCFETSGPTTHEKPVYVYNGVIHYCVPNVASRVARTASIAYSNIFTPLLEKISCNGGFRNTIKTDAGLRHGVYIYNGLLTRKVIADKFGLISRDIDLLLAAF
ncbi:alanine dehydrogenase [uncultured Sanguibacteroides sp.]|uniref:alanine dehydrogenase n=1 Tax=uncultured Sanguibacteroides sp. TaxID=1635151 RepID=UPI0025E0DD19|nr:alanine dehydrogenase [uncultured Sanguibacteroides sp.]